MEITFRVLIAIPAISFFAACAPREQPPIRQVYPYLGAAPIAIADPAGFRRVNIRRIRHLVRCPPTSFACSKLAGSLVCPCNREGPVWKISPLATIVAEISALHADDVDHEELHVSYVGQKVEEHLTKLEEQRFESQAAGEEVCERERRLFTPLLQTYSKESRRLF
jgi:hypothetical protein